LQILIAQDQPGTHKGGITDGGYSHTLAMNDLTVNDNSENGYEMKNIAGSKTRELHSIQTKETRFWQILIAHVHPDTHTGSNSSSSRASVVTV